MRERPNLKNHSVDALRACFAAAGHASYRADQVAGWLYQRAVPWALAGFLGAIAGAAWNYAMTVTFTWRAGRKPAD